MQNKILNAVVIFSGVMAALAFYGFWHTPLDTKEDTKTTPLISIQPKDHLKHTTPIEDSTFIKHHREISPPPVEYENQESEDYRSPTEVREDTQVVYENLKPQNYETIMQKADDAFVELDEHVQKTDEELKEYMTDFKPLNHALATQNSEDSNPNHEMELPIIEQ